MPSFPNFEFLKMPDCWPQAPRVKHRMRVHYVHFIHEAPPPPAIYLAGSTGADPKEADMYREKKRLRCFEHKATFSAKVQRLRRAQDSTYSIINRIKNQCSYCRKSILSQPASNNTCHTWVSVPYCSVHTSIDFERHHVAFYLQLC